MKIFSKETLILLDFSLLFYLKPLKLIGGYGIIMFCEMTIHAVCMNMLEVFLWTL